MIVQTTNHASTQMEAFTAKLQRKNKESSVKPVMMGHILVIKWPLAFQTIIKKATTAFALMGLKETETNRQMLMAEEAKRYLT